MMQILKVKRSRLSSNWRLLIVVMNKFIKLVYIYLINLPFLGRPSRETMGLVVEVYEEAFQRRLSFYNNLFYQLYGQELIQIYEIDGHKAGFALFQRHSFKEIHLFAIALKKSFQGKGLAKPFLSQCLDHWREQKFTICSLKVDRNNHSARRLYKSLDFWEQKAEEENLIIFKKLD